jgi:hypothetical protein
MSFAVRLALFLLLFASAARAEPDTLQPLRGLVGRWSSSGPSPITLEFKLVAADTTLVETYKTASGKETLTLFHADKGVLLATHYCAQGNQPRLQQTTSTPGHVVFEFKDATNLASAAASHLHRLELHLTSATTFTMIETYRENGVDDVSTLVFTRR